MLALDEDNISRDLSQAASKLTNSRWQMEMQMGRGALQRVNYSLLCVTAARSRSGDQHPVLDLPPLAQGPAGDRHQHHPFNNHQHHHHHPVLIPPQLAQVPAVETITVTRNSFQQFYGCRLSAFKSHLFYDILSPLLLFAHLPPSAAVCTRFFMCFSWEKCIDMSERENIKILLLFLHLCMDIVDMSEILLVCFSH